MALEGKKREQSRLLSLSGRTKWHLLFWRVYEVAEDTFTKVRLRTTCLLMIQQKTFKNNWNMIAQLDWNIWIWIWNPLKYNNLPVLLKKNFKLCINHCQDNLLYSIVGFSILKLSKVQIWMIALDFFTIVVEVQWKLFQKFHKTQSSIKKRADES